MNYFLVLAPLNLKTLHKNKWWCLAGTFIRSAGLWVIVNGTDSFSYTACPIKVSTNWTVHTEKNLLFILNAIYSGGQWKRDSKNVPSVSQHPLRLWKQTMQCTIKKPYKIATRNEKKYFWNVQNLLVLRTFFEKVSFWKMGVVGIKCGPYPSTIHSFSINLNEEALLKVSFENID